MALFRLFYIPFICTKYNIDTLLWAKPCNQFLSLTLLKLFFPWRWFQKNTHPTPTQIKEALITLGPIFIKFGQVLSTRSDLFSPALIAQLSNLQDRVPCFSTPIAIDIIENTFNQPLDTLFKRFECIPLAGASIAQVYGATLHTGESVVIKILRPNIHKQIKKDIRLMLFFAKILSKIHSLRRYKPLEIVEEFQKTLESEVNLMHEAANASLLRRHFLNSPMLYIPKIYWDYARPHLIVMERIHGIAISDIEALKASHINLKKLAQRGVEIFCTQVFQHSFFHADMHPGNIFVCPKNPHNPQYIAVDFGIMGTLNTEDQHYLAQNFLAFFKRDYRKIAQLHIHAGWVKKSTRINEFEAAIRTVCEPIFDRPLKDISFGASLLALFQTAQRFDMQVQPQLLLLQKTLLSIEGLGKQLYPDLNLFETVQPFLEQWIKAQMPPIERFNLFVELLKKQAPQWLDKVLHSI